MTPEEDQEVLQTLRAEISRAVAHVPEKRSVFFRRIKKIADQYDIHPDELHSRMGIVYYHYAEYCHVRSR